MPVAETARSRGKGRQAGRRSRSCTVAGCTLMQINADSIGNLGGRISGSVWP